MGNLAIGTGGVGPGNDTVVADSGATLLAREGNASSIPAVNYGHIQPRVVASENNDHYAFSAFLTDTGGFDPNTNTALFAGTIGGGPALALREGTPAPSSGGAVISQFLGEAVNSAGEILLRTNLAGAGVSSSNNEALYTNTGGPLRLVARENGLAPCLPVTNVRFSRFSKFYLADDGSVCFHAFLKGPGVDSSNDGSIWRWRNGNLHPVVREGDIAHSTDAAVVRTITSFDCSGAGGIVFTLTYSPFLGDAVTSNNIGVYLDRGAADAAPEMILRRGDGFDLGGEVRTVVGILISTESNAGGGTGGYGRAINDAGNILLNLTLSGNQSGLFMLTP